MFFNVVYVFLMCFKTNCANS